MQCPNMLARRIIQKTLLGQVQGDVGRLYQALVSLSIQQLQLGSCSKTDNKINHFHYQHESQKYELFRLGYLPIYCV